MPNCGVEDVNGDGLQDLVCHFATQETGFRPGDTEGILKGQTLDGTPIEGSDSVRVMPAPEFQFVREWGGSDTTGPGKLANPFSTAADTFGNVYVSDRGHSRVQKFTVDGEFLLAWGTPGSALGQFSSLWDIGVDGMGNVYTTETGT